MHDMNKSRNGIERMVDGCMQDVNKPTNTGKGRTAGRGRKARKDKEEAKRQEGQARGKEGRKEG